MLRGRYYHLNQKAYAMLNESLFWQPRCRSVVKMDFDGFFCPNAMVKEVPQSLH